MKHLSDKSKNLTQSNEFVQIPHYQRGLEQNETGESQIKRWKYIMKTTTS